MTAMETGIALERASMVDDNRRNNPMILEYISIVNQHGVLLPLVEVLGSQEIIPRLEAAFSGDLHPSQVLSSMHCMLEVTHDMALVAEIMTAQNLIAQPSSSEGDEAGGSGSCVLEWIAYHTGVRCEGASAAELHSQLLSTSLVQMHLARDMAVACLMLALRPSNCLQLMTAALSCGANHLAHASRACALSHFHELAREGGEEIKSLPRDQLVSLLTDDDLKVVNESDVFLALITWCQGRPEPVATSTGPAGSTAGAHGAAGPSGNTAGAQGAAGAHGPSNNPQGARPAGASGSASGRGTTAVVVSTLEVLCRQCVRSGLMSIRELEELDGRTDVGKNEVALRLVAGWYIVCLFGSHPSASTPLATPRTHKVTNTTNTATSSFTPTM